MRRSAVNAAAPFADRLAAAVEDRRSQVCLGLDPDPGARPGGGTAEDEVTPLEGGAQGARDRAAAAIAAHCLELIERAGPYCVAAKPQLARFERFGAPGWAALERVVAAAHEVGLLVIADGKRGDVPVSAGAYAEAMIGGTDTPWGSVPGLGADAFTANPLLGADSLDPLIDVAARVGAGVFAIVRTSNPGAHDVLDLPAPDAPLHERLARFVGERAERLAGRHGLSGMGAVVGATEPGFLSRLRELMPAAVFLLPGVGTQGGRVEDLAPAFAGEPAAALVTASRSIAAASDPAAAARALRDEVASLPM